MRSVCGRSAYIDRPGQPEPERRCEPPHVIQRVLHPPCHRFRDRQEPAAQQRALTASCCLRKRNATMHHTAADDASHCGIHQSGCGDHSAKRSRCTALRANVGTAPLGVTAGSVLHTVKRLAVGTLGQVRRTRRRCSSSPPCSSLALHRQATASREAKAPPGPASLGFGGNAIARVPSHVHRDRRSDEHRRFALGSCEAPLAATRSTVAQEAIGGSATGDGLTRALAHAVRGRRARELDALGVVLGVRPGDKHACSRARSRTSQQQRAVRE